MTHHPRPRATLVLSRDDDRASGRVQVDGTHDPIAVRRLDQERYEVTIGERRYAVIVANSQEADWGWVDGHTFRWPHPAAPDDTSSMPLEATSGPGGQDAITASMPATVSQVSVVVGQLVSRGETLVTLEAMKMEIPLRAPRDGRVAAVRCTEGDTVEPGIPLVELAGLAGLAGVDQTVESSDG